MLLQPSILDGRHFLAWIKFDCRSMKGNIGLFAKKTLTSGHICPGTRACTDLADISRKIAASDETAKTQPRSKTPTSSRQCDCTYFRVCIERRQHNESTDQILPRCSGLSLYSDRQLEQRHCKQCDDKPDQKIDSKTDTEAKQTTPMPQEIEWFPRLAAYRIAATVEVSSVSYIHPTAD